MENFPHLPTLLFVAAAIIVLVFILNRWLFTPLNAILAQRQAEVDSGRSEFEAAQRVQEERLVEIEARVAGARKEAFSIREGAQSEAREARDKVLAEARADAAKRVEDAKAEIDTEIAAARVQLEADADDIAQRIAERLLDRGVASGERRS